MHYENTIPLPSIRIAKNMDLTALQESTDKIILPLLSMTFIELPLASVFKARLSENPFIDSEFHSLGNKIHFQSVL